MTKGPAIFLLGLTCALFAVLMAWGMLHPSTRGIFAIMVGQLGGTLCVLAAAWVDTRKNDL